METENPIDYYVIYLGPPEKPNSYTVKIEGQIGAPFITYTFETISMVGSEICHHCGDYLLQKEINANEIYHADCKKIRQENIARRERESSLHRANMRGGL